MKLKKKNKISLACGCLLVLILVIGYMSFLIFGPLTKNSTTTYAYIDRDDSIDSVYHKIEHAGKCQSIQGFKWLCILSSYKDQIRTGRYAIEPGISMLHIFRTLSRGTQSPVMMTIPSVRSLDKLAKTLSKQLMLDSAEIATPLYDSLFYSQLGYSKETFPCLFIPNTYEVYWNISANDLMKRIEKEHDRFWNEKRRKQAEDIGLTPNEVTTLASIVEEETANNAEKPQIAGLYMNRLKVDMPLQADPTVKYAVGDFSLRRILHKHLTTNSPYNTYINIGLPPGPIRVPSIIGIESVLNYTHHKYLYMCAKEDFSGTHNFAATLTEHAANANKYWKALNANNIK